MHAQTRTNRRRGIVLVLVLGMLSLLALIGVTFATFSGQNQVGATMFAQGLAFPAHESIMDFALAQLINDTNNPVSALRGHSLKRDMYGNDAFTNGSLGILPDGKLLYLTTSSGTGPNGGPVFITNIPTLGAPQLYGLNFTRWILRLSPDPINRPGSVAQTFEVLTDDRSGTYHVIELAPGDGNPRLAQLADAVGNTNMPFTLDGRFLRAFNGPGLYPSFTASYVDPVSGATLTPSLATFGNFLFNGGIGVNTDMTTIAPALGFPNAIPSDEDYDACDLDNWFMAIQSADGSVMMPSFHRPGILTANDWRALNGQARVVGAGVFSLPEETIGRSKILRPRAVDHPASGNSFPDLVPDAASGKITYDVDNDGDGVADSVWLDLGFPVQRDASGRMFKPLFAFMVQGLNGRLPLNSAGNLQARQVPLVDLVDNVTGMAPPDGKADPGNLEPGTPTADHASHIGYSVNEINPKFAFSGTDATSAGLIQLQKLLQGSFQNGRTIAGRWGEAELLPAAITAQANNANRFDPRSPYPRAGRTMGVDGSDDDYDALDVPVAGVMPENTDFRDSSGSLQIPAERMRRFHAPIDPTGNGRVMDYTKVPASLTDYGLGADVWGRSSFFMYFRPAGVPPLAIPGPPAIPDVTTNLFHGFEAARLPRGPNRKYMAMAPWDNNSLNGAPPGLSPTFLNQVNTGFVGTPNYATFPGTGPIVVTPDPNFDGDNDPMTNNPADPTGGLYPGGGLNRDEADEMNLYEPNGFDAPFGPQDLEWLYRKHDVDGSSLDSRLRTLLPEVFDPAVTANSLKNSRLFSLESWEPTNYVWANDNPAGTFAFNSRFNMFASPSFSAYASPTALNIPANAAVIPTPSILQRDRKINLNFPFPVSNSPTEPTRIKWISDTYRALKAILPPQSIDTAHELAQLGQFVVNIVDFRDTDAAMTRWTNPDVTQGGFTPSTNDHYRRLYGPNDVIAAQEIPGSQPLVHHGMEYLPVAINEVLAYRFRRKINTNQSTPDQRMWIELVNMLSQDGSTAGTACDLDLRGWDMMITHDDIQGRPDPTTGQISETIGGTPNPSILAGPRPIPRTAPTNNTPLALPLQAMDSGGTPDDRGASRTILGNNAPGNYYNVLGTPPPPNSNPNNRSSESHQLDNSQAASFQADTELDGSFVNNLPNTGRYYWVHLRRPANPFVPGVNMVVVDSFRFPYIDASAGVTLSTDMSGNDLSDAQTAASNEAYSHQRRQPYRGAQALPIRHYDYVNGNANTEITILADQSTVPAEPLLSGFGYREQTCASQGNNGQTLYGMFGTRSSTKPMRHTLGFRNDPTDGAGGSGDGLREPFVFNDRDFQSVAELTLVPGCPPGLFTRQFVELPPAYSAPGPPPANYNVTGGFPFLMPPQVRPGGAYDGARLQLDTDRTYPFLVDKFYYTAQRDPVGQTPAVGGPYGDGWHKLFEFFEVPSSAFGAIGTVFNGQNLDWARRDVRPGMLNLNLIIDEAAFFGVLDDPRLNTALAPPAGNPLVATGIDALTGNTIGYAMDPTGNAGYYDPVTGSYTMKAAFVDFLKLRHGLNPGFDVQGVGNPRIAMFGPGAEAMFHSPSYPDVNYTIFRPALPAPGINGGDNMGIRPNVNFTPPANPPLWINGAQAPPVPPRRLFQLPDSGRTSDARELVLGPTNTGDPPFYAAGFPALYDSLFNANVALYQGPMATDDGMTYTPSAISLGFSANDRRNHPQWRGEWMDKIMNLTTVRTHQYAVWVTVGFFEVVKPGNPLVAQTNPVAAVDQLGTELLKDGRHVRYRGFFLIDRTKATGFNPSDPGDFRECVTFRRRIE